MVGVKLSLWSLNLETYGWCEVITIISDAWKRMVSVNLNHYSRIPYQINEHGNLWLVYNMSPESTEPRIIKKWLML